MGITEILLVAIGAVAFVASFLIPEKYTAQENVNTKTQEEKLKKILEEELKQAQFRFEEKADESLTAATEKTERYMERLTNEKIMAIEEYSDTVLDRIHKNHEEAVFLYDMLNNKHAQVKNTAAEINLTVEDAKANLQNTIQQNIIQQNTSQEQFVPVLTETKVEVEPTEYTKQDEEFTELKDSMKNVKKPAPKKKAPVKKATILNMQPTEETANIEIQFDLENNMGGNNKDKILQLHKEGKSNMAIAKALGLGVGEVKLVIDLFKGV